MKKILLTLLFISSIFAQDIKTNYFIGANTGEITVTSGNNTQNYLEGKLGFYFYDANKYFISNRIYVSGLKVFTDTSSFYTANLNLDWIWTQIPFIKPFVGINAGYVYFVQGDNYSGGMYGFKAGALLYLGDYLELEIGGETHNTNTFPDNLKQIYVGANFSF